MNYTWNVHYTEWTQKTVALKLKTTDHWKNYFLFPLCFQHKYCFVIILEDKLTYTQGKVVIPPFIYSLPPLCSSLTFTLLHYFISPEWNATSSASHWSPCHSWGAEGSCWSDRPPHSECPPRCYPEGPGTADPLWCNVLTEGNHTHSTWTIWNIMDCVVCLVFRVSHQLLKFNQKCCKKANLHLWVFLVN